MNGIVERYIFEKPEEYEPQIHFGIHDARLDYYGRKLATCSSDRIIKIFDIDEKGEQKLEIDLKGHDGPVWQVDWAHPQFGRILASCSYDHKIFIWKQQNQKWDRVFEHKCESSVNSISWAPAELGLILVAASSDSTLTFITYRRDDQRWETKSVSNAHRIGCNAVSWAPATPVSSLTNPDSQNNQQQWVKRVVSGGGDNLACIWEYRNGDWERVHTLKKHSDWIRDVAWAPNIGLPYDTIATCSQDKTVVIWSNDSGEWKDTATIKMDAVVWRVSWSITANLLCVSTADNKVSLFKQGVDGSDEWKKVGALNAA